VAAGARITLVVWTVAGALAAAGAPGAAPPISPATTLELLDLSGRAIRPLDHGKARAIVFVFARSDCPISNRYAPEMRRLHARFAAGGVAFWLVYTERAESGEALARHHREFVYPFGALRDHEHALVRMAGATVTPEAAVFVSAPNGPRLVYRGRIDDRYVAFGNARAAPATRDLEGVLDAILAGQAPTARTTTAIGCFISPIGP
jgi:hypothetical protein